MYIKFYVWILSHETHQGINVGLRNAAAFLKVWIGINFSWRFCEIVISKFKVWDLKFH